MPSVKSLTIVYMELPKKFIEKKAGGRQRLFGIQSSRYRTCDDDDGMSLQPDHATARHLEVGVLHDYGKSPRPGRKLGHITVTSETADERDKFIDTIHRTVTRSS